MVVVDHEDLAEFRDQPFMTNVDLISTRDVLSRQLEARRRSYRLRRRQLEWWKCRYYGVPLHGWAVQQIIKLPRLVSCRPRDTFA